MSSRLMRMLLKLYPRRIRNRYGDELLDLQSELEARGELSRTRLLRDMLAGALLVRRARRQTRLIIGTLIVGLLAAGAIIGSRGIAPRARASHVRARLMVGTALAVPPTCFVAGGSSCSLTPCTEFVSQPSTLGAAYSSLPAPTGLRWRLSQIRWMRRPNTDFVPTISVPAPRHCIAHPHLPSPRSAFVAG